MTITDLKLPLTETSLRHTLRKYGVIEAKLFGSYARGEQNANSDLDIYVQFRPGTSLFDVFDLQAELERKAGTKVDLATKINPHFAEYIERDFINIAI